MKKFLKLLFIVTLFFVCNSACFAIVNQTGWNSAESLKRINTIGQKLLESNHILDKITFLVSNEDHVNAYTNIKNEIYVYKGLLNQVETDDELASVIAHEMGHIVNKHLKKQTVIDTLALNPISKLLSLRIKNPFMSKTIEGAGVIYLLKFSRKDEIEADLTGADLMIEANYNPLAMISFLNKIQGSQLDILSSHPSTEKRTVNVYNYLSYNYPMLVKKDYNTQSYKNFKANMDLIIKDRIANPAKMTQYQITQSKLREERLRKAQSIVQGTNIWESTYMILQSAIQDGQNDPEKK